MKSTAGLPLHVPKAQLPDDSTPEPPAPDESGRADSTPSPLAKPDVAPAFQPMSISNELGFHATNPQWSLVEQFVRELDPGYFNSYACMSIPGNTYIQCLRGFNGYHLEARATHPDGAYIHYRACYPGGSTKRFELKKHNHVNDGEFRDLLHLDDVLDSFHAFHQNEGLPDFLEWRRLDI